MWFCWRVCPGDCNAARSLAVLALVVGLSSMVAAGESVRLDCAPREFQVVPGEPMRLQLTVCPDSAVPLRWHVPGEPLLKLRAVEKLPVRRTRDGVVVYRRVVVWQGLEPGAVTLRTLSIETRQQKLVFPEVIIVIRDPAP